MSRVRRRYPSDLDDLQWQHIERMLPTASSRGRPRQICLRRVIEAIFYLNRTGCAWRYLPGEFPRWQTVYAYYASWKRKGVIQKIHDYLVSMVRRLEKRRPAPSALIVDSQSIKAPWGKPKRWIVERTFGWFNNYRRLSKDYEKNAASSEGMIYVAMIQLMLRRLSRPQGSYRRWQ